MLAKLFGKYKTLVVSIALFLLLDATVLMMNFYTSFQISGDAQAINLTGRQRMLSQRMVKILYEIDQAREQGQVWQAQLVELSQSAKLFGDTLAALEHGGRVEGRCGENTGGKGSHCWIRARCAFSAKAIWATYSPLINAVINAEDQEAQQAALIPALEFARANSANLLSFMNLLTQEMELAANAKSHSASHHSTGCDFPSLRQFYPDLNALFRAFASQ